LASTLGTRPNRSRSLGIASNYDAWERSHENEVWCVRATRSRQLAWVGRSNRASLVLNNRPAVRRRRATRTSRISINTPVELPATHLRAARSPCLWTVGCDRRVRGVTPIVASTLRPSRDSLSFRRFCLEGVLGGCELPTRCHAFWLALPENGRHKKCPATRSRGGMLRAAILVAEPKRCLTCETPRFFLSLPALEGLTG